jgi:hypothetical protein
VTFVIVLLALVLTGWVSAQISDVRPIRPIVRTASIGVLSMTITNAAGHLFHPQATEAQASTLDLGLDLVAVSARHRHC